MFQQKLQSNSKQILCSITFFFFENRTDDGIMPKNFIELDSSQKTIRRMHTACWIPKAINTHSKYVMFIAPPLLECFQGISRSLEMHRLSGRFLLMSDSKHLVRQDTVLQNDPPRVFSDD